MKKVLLFSFIMLLFGWQSYCQTQRKVLVEEFTQASCGPCASANPAFNALLQANLTKAAAIKYQVWWPGYDPMYFHNTADVDARVALYGITGVPHAHMDGSAYNAHPSNFNQTKIDTEYAIPSSFTIGVTHSLSADYDSIFITLTITATEPVTSGNLKAYAVLTENHIHFNTPPGSNGETDFYNVMKKMYPDADGNTLPATWTTGQVETINFAEPIPWAVYKINEIAIVAFVQDMTSLDVKQAEFSAPIIQPGDPNLDIEVAAITTVPLINCTVPFDFDISLVNAGTTTITSAFVNYQIDNGTITTMPWNGSIAAGASSIVNITGINPAPGEHSVKVWASSPNGMGDLLPFNNTKSIKFFIVTGAAGAIPVEEGFEGTITPPAGWLINDGNDNGLTWAKSTPGGFGTSNSSMMIPFFGISTTGETDELYLPPIDLSTVINPFLWFDLAYARYSASYNDRLKVQFSTNCGQSWTDAYNKAGATLATTPSFVTSSFVPTSNQWRTDVVDLNAAAGQSKVFIRFQGISGYSNNLYLDNIRLYPSGVSVSEIEAENSLEVLPNPFNNNAEMTINITEPSNVKVCMYNSIGSICHTEDFGVMQTGKHTSYIDGSAFPAGIYYIMLNIDGISLVKKVSITK